MNKWLYRKTNPNPNWVTITAVRKKCLRVIRSVGYSVPSGSRKTGEINKNGKIKKNLNEKPYRPSLAFLFWAGEKNQYSISGANRKIVKYNIDSFF